MAIGTFVGLMPFIGMQILVSVVLCYWLRINITAAVLATFITNPFTTPFLIPLQFKLGQWVMQPWKHLNEVSTHGVNHYLVEYGLPFVAGAFVSSIIGALLAYPITHWAWRGVTGIAHLRPHLHEKKMLHDKKMNLETPETDSPSHPAPSDPPAQENPP